MKAQGLLSFWEPRAVLMGIPINTSAVEQVGMAQVPRLLQSNVGKECWRETPGPCNSPLQSFSAKLGKGWLQLTEGTKSAECTRDQGVTEKNGGTAF